MDGNTLFGYSIEENDGSLVITIRGTLAEAAIRQLRAGLESGGTLPLQSLLSPLLPIGRLLSAPIALEPAQEPEAEAATLPDTGVLSQELEQTYAAFQEQMREFRARVDELKAEQRPAKATTRRGEG